MSKRYLGKVSEKEAMRWIENLYGCSRKKWAEGTKYLILLALHAFQVGKVQIYFGKLKNFGLSFLHNYSRNMQCCPCFQYHRILYLFLVVALVQKTGYL